MNNYNTFADKVDELWHQYSGEDRTQKILEYCEEFEKADKEMQKQKRKENKQ